MLPGDPREYLRIPLSRMNLKQTLNLRTPSSLSDSSAFFIFCSEKRPEVKSAHPGFGIGDIAKKLGEMWNNTPSEEKVPFEKKASKLKEKYDKVKSLIVRQSTTMIITIVQNEYAAYHCLLTLSGSFFFFCNFFL